MLILVVDDEEKALRDVGTGIKKSVPDAEIRTFLRLEDAVASMKEDLSGDQKLEVRCFGYFDVLWKGQPLIFARKQSKELLAYLIDREGAACSSGEIALALWEDEVDEKAEKNRIRVLINDLRNVLRGIGMEDVLIRDKREIAIQRDLLDCDYYRLLNGDMTKLDSYRGEYMKQYGWAEVTNARLEFLSREEPQLRDSFALYY